MCHLKDLKDLSPAEIVTNPLYGFHSARQALYTIATQLSNSDDSDEWNEEWDIASLMRSGVYSENFKTHWQLRAKTKVSLKTGPQEDSSIPKKKINLKVVPVNPDEDWVTGREDVLQELVKDSCFLQLSTAIVTYNYERAREAEGDDPTNYLTRNLRTWFADCIQLDASIVSMKNKMFCEIFEELDQTYTTLGAHLTECVQVLFKCFKLRLEPDFENVTKFLKSANDCIENLQEIFQNLHPQFPNAPNPEWLLPFMLTYSIVLQLYDNIAQDYKRKLVQEE